MAGAPRTRISVIGGGGGAVIGNANRDVLVGQKRLIQELQPAARPVDGANFVHKSVKDAECVDGALCYSAVRLAVSGFETGKK